MLRFGADAMVRAIIDTDCFMYVADSKREAWKNHCRMLLLHESLVKILTTVAGIFGSQRIMS